MLKLHHHLSLALFLVPSWQGQHDPFSTEFAASMHDCRNKIRGENIKIIYSLNTILDYQIDATL